MLNISAFFLFLKNFLLNGEILRAVWLFYHLILILKRDLEWSLIHKKEQIYYLEIFFDLKVK
jgi:hypothetical protein